MKTTKSGKGLKEFPSWNQFVAILFLPVRPGSLIVRNLRRLASCMGKPKYIGIDNASYRSTLSCVNEKRPWRLYEAVFYRLLERYGWLLPRRRSSVSEIGSPTSLPWSVTISLPIVISGGGLIVPLRCRPSYPTENSLHWSFSMVDSKMNHAKHKKHQPDFNMEDLPALNHCCIKGKIRRLDYLGQQCSFLSL